MAHYSVTQLVFVAFALLLIRECSFWQLNRTRFDVQVKIFRSPEKTVQEFRKALRSKIRKFKRKAKFGGDLDFTTPYYLHSGKSTKYTLPNRYCHLKAYFIFITFYRRRSMLR